MRNIPLLLKHSVILIGVMSILVVILVWYSVTHIMKVSEHDIAEASLAETKASLEQAEKVMGTIVESSVRLATSQHFENIRDIRSIADLNRNVSYITHASLLQKELVELNKVNSGITSSFVHINDTDYVISTDKGITALHNYESMNWMNAALETREGIQGIWFIRWDPAGNRSVFSYILPIQSLNGITGNIVVNVVESQFSQYLASKQKGFNEYLLVNENGYIISHLEKERLFKPIGDDVIHDESYAGYTYRMKDGNRQLITWSRSSDMGGWLYITVYDVSKQMETVFMLQKNIYGLALFMIIVGTLLSLIITKRLSAPVKKLVAMVSGRSSDKLHSKNELLILKQAFQKMKDEEEELQRLLNEREKDTKDIAVQQLLRGEVTDHVHKLFNRKNFQVAIMSIDAYRTYSIRNSREAKSLHRNKWLAEIDCLSIDNTNIKCIAQGDGYYVLIINSDNDGCKDSDQLSVMLTSLQQKAAEIFQQSVTISVSHNSRRIHDINAQYLKALEGMKQRMLQGCGRIYSCPDSISYEQSDFYPEASEKKIGRLINQCDFESIKLELANIRDEIRMRKGMSPDHVLLICLQLVSSTIKHLRELNVNVQRLFTSNKNIYTQLAKAETLDEVQEALVSFYEDSINLVLEYTEGVRSQYGDKIIQYLNNKYREDIVFEEMAKEIGISYSYARKIIVEMTGMSLMDYVHSLRINAAKELLTSAPLTIAQVAVEVGYHNIRSFNRFFQKVENMTPSAYRSQHGKAISSSQHA